MNHRFDYCKVPENRLQPTLTLKIRTGKYVNVTVDGSTELYLLFALI